MNMQRNTLLRISLILFVAGVATFALLRIYRGVPTESLEVSLLNFNNSEESEEYAVYSALLNEMFVKEGAKLLVIEKETLFYGNPDYLKQTTTEERILDMKKYYPSVSEETLRDYESKHMKASTLSSDFHLPINYILIDEVELKKDKDGSRIDSFYKKNFSGAGGMISVSKVGFNKNRTEAFVSVEFIFCPLCSHGDEVLLEKNVGVWKIKEIFGVWAS